MVCVDIQTAQRAVVTNQPLPLLRMVYVISSKDFEIRFNIIIITHWQIINWKFFCLFLLNVAFNNCSVISRRCLVATGSNAHVLRLLPR